MKKILLILCALVCGTLAFAQTVVHSCVADIDDWTATFTNTHGSSVDEHFVYNYWSTEDDGTGMTAPFLEYWAGAGNNLDDATIAHETISATNAGYYNVSVFARLYNENNSTAPGAEEIYFHANEESVDLATGTPTSYGTSAVIYGTYTLLVYLEEAGDIEISFTVDSETSCDWLAFKNLSVEYLGTEMPKLDYVTGTMNVDVEAAMKEAVDQYNTTFNSDDYLVALEAIEAAEASVAYYAPIVAAVNALDTDGAAVWATSNYAAMLEACTLTNEDVSADLAAAQKAQTTAGTDWSYVLTSTGTWSSSAHPAFDPSTTFEYYGDVSEGKVIYKTVSDLPAGTYTVSFYGAASLNNETSGVTSVADGASVYANEASQTIDINNLTGSDYGVTGWPEDELYTFKCTILDGTLEFGVSAGSQSNKGKWYIAKAVSLTLDELGVELEPGDDVHSCVAEVDHWTIAGNTNGDFHYNDWSTEADASGLVVPFLEYWVGSWEGNLSAATISHKQLTGLPAGYYEVSLDIRIFSEAGNEIGEGTTFNANNASEDLVLGKDHHDDVYGTETEVYGTYTIEAYVDETGTLDISLSITDATYNWISFKNLKVAVAEETTISWEMTDAGWGTMILPFAADVPSGLTLYAGDQLTEDNTTSTIVVGEAATSVVANTPYLVSGTANTYTFTGVPTNEAETYTVGLLTGTYVTLGYDDFYGVEANDGSTVYLLQNHDDEGLAFYPVTSESTEATLTPYHCYLDFTGAPGEPGDDEPAPAKLSIVLPGAGGETAIKAVESDVIASDAIYDLSGRRVAKAVKGVYIQNGKKVLVK